MDELEEKRLAALSLVLIIERERRKKMKTKRNIWTREWLRRREKNQGVLSMLFGELGPEDPKSFTNFTRMDKAALEELLNLVGPHITKKDTVMRETITVQYRLAATLRFLATGNSYKDLSYSTRIAPNTLAQIVPDTLHAIAMVLKNKIKCPGSASEWESVAGQFHSQWQFPHCIGAIDGKHIKFRPSREDGSKYRNYKGSDSIILFALVDANYKFLYVDVGRNGRMHDSRVFNLTPLSHMLFSGKLNLPVPSPLPGCTVNLPYFMVADDAFQLKENIMKPYPGRNITARKKIFNYQLSRARRVVENAFGILSNKFRILLTVIPLSADKVELIVYVCCLLHNFLLEKNNISMEKYNESIPSDLSSVNQQGGNHASERASSVRDHLCNYFNTIGSVPWQNEAVEKGNC